MYRLATVFGLASVRPPHRVYRVRRKRSALTYLWWVLLIPTVNINVYGLLTIFVIFWFLFGSNRKSYRSRSPLRSLFNLQFDLENKSKI